MHTEIKIPKTIFREYDIRGDAQEELTDDLVELLGKAYGTYMNGGEVLVGYDNRLSSERIFKALIKGLQSTGCKVINIGLTITPILYFSRIHYGIDGGVMITASHNPPNYNGFKLCKGNATLYGKEIGKIRDIMVDGNFLKGNGSVEERDPVQDYYSVLKEKISLARSLKVVLDCGNGTASLFAPTVLKNWGCEVVEMYCSSDGSFPNHIPDPVKEEYAVELKEKVLDSKADIGIGIDGDADRIGIIDEKGNMIWGDQMLILFFRELLLKHPGEKAIIEVKCSQALVDDVVAHGGKPMFWKTGHSLIKAKMQEEGALLSGEMSGHMFFKDEYYGYDDALYAAGRFLRILAASGKTVSQLFYDTPKYFATPEMRPYCDDEVKFDIVKKIVDRFKGEYEVIDVDGARVLFGDGWGLIRSSNTQPALIVRAEGKTPEARDRIKNILFNELAKYPEVKLEKY